MMLRQTQDRVTSQHQQHIQQLEMQFLSRIEELEHSNSVAPVDAASTTDAVASAAQLGQNSKILDVPSTHRDSLEMYQQMAWMQLHKDTEITRLREYCSTVYGLLCEWRVVITMLRRDRYLILQRLCEEHASRTRNSLDMDYVRQIFIRYLQFDALHMESERRALHPVIARMLV
uniref:Uncharacterized protein n=2 Tax=Lygus hesperus TaxID=30085 RepID=A0A146LXP5_LYGHE